MARELQLAATFSGGMVRFQVIHQTHRQGEFQLERESKQMSNGIYLSSRNFPEYKNGDLAVRGSNKSEDNKEMECTLQQYLEILEAVQEYNRLGKEEKRLPPVGSTRPTVAPLKNYPYNMPHDKDEKIGMGDVFIIYQKGLLTVGDINNNLCMMCNVGLVNKIIALGTGNRWDTLEFKENILVSELESKLNRKIQKIKTAIRLNT